MVRAGVTPARMSTPGAVRSGLSTLGSNRLGPREEKLAITGAGVVPMAMRKVPKAALAPGVWA